MKKILLIALFSCIQQFCHAQLQAIVVDGKTIFMPTIDGLVYIIKLSDSAWMEQMNGGDYIPLENSGYYSTEKMLKGLHKQIIRKADNSVEVYWIDHSVYEKQPVMDKLLNELAVFRKENSESTCMLYSFKIKGSGTEDTYYIKFCHEESPGGKSVQRLVCRKK